MPYGAGSFPSITFHNGVLWLVLQDFSRLRVYREDMFVVEVQLSDPSAAFPVLASMGALWLVFRERTDGKLINLDNGDVVVFGQPGGNSPMQLADGFVWWQEGDGTWRAPVGSPLSRERVNSRITPTGLVAIRSGQPVYWDDVAGTQPGMIVSGYGSLLVVGEGTNGGALVRSTATGREHLHWPGRISFKPQVAEFGTDYAVTTWEHEVRVERGNIADLHLPDPVDPTDPTDPTDPEDPSMPDSLLSSVEEVYVRRLGSLTRPPTADECAAVLNEVAWLHRAAGWGLSKKPGGHHATQPGTGIPVAYDILQHKPTNTLWDALGPSEWPKPLWGQAEPHHDDANRPWVAPVQPVTEDPTDPTNPTDPTDPQPDCTCKAEIAALKAEITDLGRTLDAASTRLTKLENAPAQQLPELVARGRISLGIFGSKAVELPVVPK
jgi:hypothetical protein